MHSDRKYADTDSMKYYAVPAFLLCTVSFLFAESIPQPAETVLNPLETSPAVSERASVQTASAQVPQLLAGLWNGSDRYVYLPAAELGTSSPELTIILKTLYGWYYDRAAEPASYSKEYPRTVNSVTSPDSVDISAQFREIPVTYVRHAENPDSGVWEMIVHYAKDEDVSIPVAVIGKNLYLDFAVKTVSSTASGTEHAEEPLTGYWQGQSSASGIMIAPPVVADGFVSLYITGQTVYRIRYWKTDMEYVPGEASFTDQNISYSVLKHIVSAGNVYTCAEGRRLLIRNADIEKTQLPLRKYTLDSTETICAFGSPYLTRTEKASDVSALMQIVAQANARRKPDPKPLFPPEDLDWHWDDINRLEKDNTMIQAVRKRQKEFAEKASLRSR